MYVLNSKLSDRELSRHWETSPEYSKVKLSIEESGLYIHPHLQNLKQEKICLLAIERNEIRHFILLGEE